MVSFLFSRLRSKASGRPHVPNFEAVMLRSEETKSTVTGVDVKLTPATTAVSGGPVAATTITSAGQLAPIQQQPSGQPRRVRDELDPAPHHTAADIRVLEILKRIRDSGSVGDDDLDIPPPKRKPGRTRMERPTFTRQAPAPVLPQPQATTTATTTSATTTIALDSFKVPLSSRLDSIRPRTTTAAGIPSQLKNGTPTPPAIVLAATNGTAVPVTTGLVATTAAGGSVTAPTAVAVIQQKQPATTTGGRTNQQAPQQIGLELILPNGLRIPVSATCAKSDAQIQQTTTAITVASTGGIPVTAAVNKLSSTVTPTAVTRTSTTTTSTSQQICSCSRSKCLKLYCECFAAGRACGDSCNCRHCYNNLADDISKQTRDVAMRTALSRNPLAFKPKIEISGKHVLGCRCKRSHCLKGYCECYLAKIPCNQRCRCLGCSNEETTTTNTSTTATTTTTTSTTSVNAATNATSTTAAGAEPIKETQISWLASLATRQQVAAAASAGSTTTPIGIVAAGATTITTSATATVTTTPSIAATVTAVTATPRTITLNVPIKALAAASETGGVIAHPAGSSTDLPPLLLHQSYLAAAAAAAAAAGGANQNQQDLLKCLNSVLPAVQSQPQLQSPSPHFIIPGVVQTRVTAGRPADASGTETTASATVAAPVSKLSPPLSIATKTERVEDDEVNNVATTSSGASPGRLNDDSTDDDDDRNGVSIGDGGDIAEEDNYSGYTEEELAFMQRLQQNRNTATAPATGVSQVMKKEDVSAENGDAIAVAGDVTRESPQSLASDRGERGVPPPLHESLFSSSSSSSSSSAAYYPDSVSTSSVTALLPGVSLVPQQSQLQEPQSGIIVPLRQTVPIGLEDKLPVLSYSAPPSLGPGSEERLLGSRCSALEVRFMRRKIDELEAQVSQMTQLIRTQGEMLTSLTEMLQRQHHQQAQTQHQL
ncbi:Protein lin-54 [Taenia crassiceps]|uniref:Protein lin-54 n=1 Tax=Taenia crassiceps TaxID=6207 RepID=A0ABR4QBE4_9CEST